MNVNLSGKSNPGLQRGFVTPYRALENALKSGEPVWVLNNSIPKSRLHLTISDPLSGKAKSLEFPPTFIPFCVSDMVPRDILERSLELRTFIQKNILKFITEEEAVGIISSEKGRKEYARLNSSEFANTGVISDRVAEMIGSIESAGQILNTTPTGDVAQPSTLHPKLKIWEDLLTVGTLDTDGLLSELDIYTNEFTKDDCEHLASGKYPDEVKAWAKGKLESGVYLNSPVVPTAATIAARVDESGEDDAFVFETL
jgi:hypothetical protein